jgi:hypothetical protein
VVDYSSGYVSRVSIISRYTNKQKYDRNHHESYDYQGINYLIHSPFELPSRFSKKHQTIANSSIIVLLNPTKIVIDEALESYKPKRFVDSIQIDLNCICFPGVAAISRKRNR